MSQRLRGMILAGNSDQDNQPKAFEITFYVLMCFLVASMLWLITCYLLYKLVRGCTLNGDPNLLDNYDVLESEYSGCDGQPERVTRWKRLLGFTKQKFGEPSSTHSLQLVHVGPAPRTQSMPVLVNLDGKSLFIQHKSFDQH